MTKYVCTGLFVAMGVVCIFVNSPIAAFLGWANAAYYFYKLMGEYRV